MSVPVKHHTHGKVGRRRSHLALKPTAVHACLECKAPVLPHRVCGNCGTMQTRAMKNAAAGIVRSERPAKVAKAETKKAEEAEEEVAVEASAEEPAEAAEDSAPAEA